MTLRNVPIRFGAPSSIDDLNSGFDILSEAGISSTVMGSMTGRGGEGGRGILNCADGVRPWPGSNVEGTFSWMIPSPAPEPDPVVKCRYLSSFFSGTGATPAVRLGGEVMGGEVGDLTLGETTDGAMVDTRLGTTSSSGSDNTSLLGS